MVKYLDPNLIVSVLYTETTPRNPYATGYGSKIPTRYMVRLNDGRLRRVYAMCYGNASSLYVIADCTEQFLSDSPQWYAQQLVN